MNLRARPEPDLALVQACEERIVNAWPAPTTLLMDGWVVRMANGYSGRANSASPLTPGADLDEAALTRIEALFRGMGLTPCVRVTPLAAPDLRERLVARGYRVKDSSFGMIAPLADWPVRADPDLDVASAPSDGWIASICSFQVPSKRNPAHLAAIVRNIRLPAAFATLSVEGCPVAFGMSVAERGMAEIGAVMVDESLRGKGLGRRLVSGLMGWARAQGAEQAYLQVDQANPAAIGLYASMSYRKVYAYDTMVLPG